MVGLDKSCKFNDQNLQATDHYSIDLTNLLRVLSFFIIWSANHVPTEDTRATSSRLSLLCIII